MPGRLLAFALLLLALVGGTAAAQSSRPLGMHRLVVDRAELEPSILHGLLRLRVYVSAMNLGELGKVHDVDPDAFTIGGSPSVKEVPYTTGRYQAVDTQTAVVIVLQLSGLGPDLAEIKTAIDEELLTKLKDDKQLQVAVIGYGEGLDDGKLGTVAKAQSRLANLEDPDPANPTQVPDLVRAVDRAVKLLRKVKPLEETRSREAIRKMVIVVSDGRTADDDQAAITHLGKSADKAGVRIHSIGYSPPPEPRRRPLFSLGELSKMSQGTFRWVQTKADQNSLRVPFQRVLDEIQRQYVLTMFVPADEPPTKVMVEASLAGKNVKSRELKLKEAWCAAVEDPCKPDQYCSIDRCQSRKQEEGIGFFGYLWRILLVVLGLLAALIGVGFVITKVRERQGAATGEPKPVPPPKKPLPGATGAIAAAAGPPLTAAQRAMQVPITGPHLYIMTGPQANQRVALRHGFQIGKADDCDLSLEHDGFASSHHAQIVVGADGWWTLIDQNSTNGTFVNGVRVTGQQRLEAGMSIRCGSTDLRFLAQP